MSDAFKLTYSTMFNPPPELHARFDAALAEFKHSGMGRDHPQWIDGAAAEGGERFEVRSPIDQDWLIGRFVQGSADDVDRAVQAARAAYPAWAATPWRERVALLRRAARLIEERVYAISAAVAVEVGKNRMEAIGEVQETADLIDWYADRMEEADGFDRPLADDPLPNFKSHNRSVLRPYGVWAVIAPFNFPFALAGGPLGPALIAGNTAVVKCSPQTSLSGWLLLECLRDAGLPPGVINFVTGGDTTGRALAQHPDVAGITFTGSHAVGMQVLRASAAGRYPKPCITEMGGKNATIVSRHGDVERAALGILRSAFGLSGQKCSACSRVYVERPLADALRERLVQLTRDIAVGDPTQQAHWMGPVIDRAAYDRCARLAEHLRQVGQIDTGGAWLTEGDLARGFFVAPTVAQAPLDDRAWVDEHFLPVVLVGEVDSVAEGIARANASDYGLTAGFYGTSAEVAYFHNHIEAGVTYANRPQGATTGAWPGFQPFGGWKGSGSTGKAIGSFHYLQQYLREQSRTVVE